jgi:hypothetical protein
MNDGLCAIKVRFPVGGHTILHIQDRTDLTKRDPNVALLADVVHPVHLLASQLGKWEVRWSNFSTCN